MSTKTCLVAVLALVAAGARAEPAALKDSVPHITATGTASVEIVPDRAELRLGIGNERLEAAAATQVTAKAAADVVADIEARGIAAKNIKTSFDLTAQFDTESDAPGRGTRQKLRGYLAYESIIVRLEDVKKAGTLAGALVGKGANAFDGISFTYSRRKEALRELNAAALRDALAEARSYTDAAGLKLGRVLQIGADPQAEVEVMADMPSRRAVRAYAGPVPLEPGTQKLSQSVTVIWEIEGKTSEGKADTNKAP